MPLLGFGNFWKYTFTRKEIKNGDAQKNRQTFSTFSFPTRIRSFGQKGLTIVFTFDCCSYLLFF